MVVGIRKHEFRGRLPNPGCSARGRQLPGLVKDDEAESAQNQQTEGSQNWARDFSSILLRLTEGAPQADQEQRKAGAEEQEVHPGDVTGDWKPGK